TEKNAAAAAAEVAEVLARSIGALTGGLAIAANEFSHVSRELAAAEALTPARQAQNVLGSAIPFITDGFLGMPLRAVLSIPLLGAGAGLTLSSSDLSDQSAGASFAHLTIKSARAAEPQGAGWSEFGAGAARLLNGFAQVKPAIERAMSDPAATRAIPAIAPLMLRHSANADAALRAAFAAAGKRDGAAAVRAMEAAAGIFGDMLSLGRMVDGQFRSALGEFAGAGAYDAIATLAPQALYLSVLARALQSEEIPSPPRDEIVSDPRAAAYRAEQISAEETARKAAELRVKLRDVEAQLKKDPQNAALAATADELGGVIANLDRIVRAIPFAMKEIKAPTLSCSPLNTDAILRKVKEFAVATEVMPLLRKDAEERVREAEAAIRAYYAGKFPAWAIDDLITRLENDPAAYFQKGDEEGKGSDDAFPYRKKSGRLRYGVDPKKPNQAAGGIFSAEGISTGRENEILMVGIYMMEDAFARFAADCTKPPSAVIREVMDKLAAYIDKTSALSSDGAKDTVTEKLKERVQAYAGGLAALLRDLDSGVYGNVAHIVDNVGVVNRSWTAVAPDITALLAEVKSALAALKALGFETEGWIDALEAAVAQKPGAEKTTTPKDLILKCPTKSTSGKECKPLVQEIPVLYRGTGICSALGELSYEQLGALPKSNVLDPGLGFTELDPKTGLPKDPLSNYANELAGNRIDPRQSLMCAAYGFPNSDKAVNGSGCTNPPGDITAATYLSIQWVATPDGQKTITAACGFQEGVVDPDNPCNFRPLEDLCGAGAAEGGAGSVAQCPTGSAAEQEKLLTLLRKCVTKEQKDRVSLAFIWEQAKLFIRALVLEKLQHEMDVLPATITEQTQNMLLSFSDDYTSKLIVQIRQRRFEDKYLERIWREGDLAVVGENDKVMRNAIKRIRFTGVSFAPYWSNASGPDILSADTAKVSQAVYRAVSDEVERNISPIAAPYRLVPHETGVAQHFSGDKWWASYAAGGAAAARSAALQNIAQNFKEYWGVGTGPNSTFHGVLSSALKATLSDAKSGILLPTLESFVARHNLPSRFGFDLSAFLDEFADPKKSSLPLKQMFVVADAIDRVANALKKLSQKSIEFNEAVTACVTAVDSGKGIGDILQALSDAFPQDKNLKNLAQGAQSGVRVVEGKKEDTAMDNALNDILQRSADRLTREAAAALKRAQGVGVK
ncbi:MAG: hypothetical protein HYT82_00230, partial [Candidatus Harrisonbacteria bacterium]|nr:hypothetical protein [Candidatus Harrisonbacteria bacterium]